MNVVGEPAGNHFEEGGTDAVILDVHQYPEHIAVQAPSTLYLLVHPVVFKRFQKAGQEKSNGQARCTGTHSAAIVA